MLRPNTVRLNASITTQVVFVPPPSMPRTTVLPEWARLAGGIVRFASYHQTQVIRGFSFHCTFVKASRELNAERGLVLSWATLQPPVVG